MKTIISSDRIRQRKYFSQAILFKHLLFISGQVGIDGNGQLVSNDFEQQTEQTFSNIGALLERANLSFRNVLKITAFLTDRKYYSVYNEIRFKYFKEDPPASSTVIVNGLVDPRYLIEIEMIAGVD